MYLRVLETIKKNNMLKAGDKVVCALSGGADSMALLCALYEIKDKLEISIYAAHVNHCIRGLDADSDEAFVKDFCQKAGIELFVKRVNVPQKAKEMHMSEEECGRYERYLFFDEICKNLGGGVIATGHHRNDNAETVLFNLFRGSSLRGLKGISYKRDNIIRPLLDISKKDIENYLKENNIPWREDYTNKNTQYTRNKLRLIIIKEIEKHFPDAVEKIASCAEAVGIDDDYLNNLAHASGAFEKGCIYAEKFETLHESLKRRVIVMALEEWEAGVDREKINAVYETVIKGTGKVRDIGNQVRIVNNYGIVSKIEKQQSVINDEKYRVNVNESREIQVFGGVWSIKTVDKTQKMRDNKMMIILDADKLGEEVFIRTRCDGDYISPVGMSGTKKLKKVFIDLKIPQEKRDRISMLAKEDEILFIPGIRKTKNYSLDENTRRLFVAEYKTADR